MTMKIYVHDVGAGHAVHVFTPDGKLVVIDLGCSADFSPLTWLRNSGWKTIDLLVVTHPHGDHIDEIVQLDKQGFTVRQLSRPNWLTEAEIRAANQGSYKAEVDKYIEMNAKFNGTIPANEKLVDNPNGTGGALIRTFWSSSCGRANINNHSGVVALTFASSTVIIPGDNEPPSWQALLQDPVFVSTIKAADLFLASHHGRESGYCADVFADNRKPKLFVISDGKVRTTDAAPAYSQQSLGWTVRNRSRTKELSKNVVTTRTNGRTDITLGYNTPSAPYLMVEVDTLL